MLLSVSFFQNYKPNKNADAVMLSQTATITAQPTPIPGIAPTTAVRITDGTTTPAGVTVNTSAPIDVMALTQSRIKALQNMADKMGCSLTQLAVAWCLRNSTSQSVIASANTTEHLLEILGSLPVNSRNLEPKN